MGSSFFSPRPSGPPRLQAHWLPSMPGLSFAYCMLVDWILWGSAASSSTLAPQRLLHQFLGSRKYERHRGYRQQGSRIKGEENGKPPALWKYHINPGNCGRLTALTSKCGRAVDSLYSLQNPVKANPSSCKGVVLTGYCLV